jgi:hypothetical protein
MWRSAIVVGSVVSCSGAGMRVPSHRAEATLVATPRELRFDEPSWRLAGAVERIGGGLRLRYCCTKNARAELALAGLIDHGRWQIAIDHVNPDCRRGLFALVYVGNERRPITTAQLDRRAGVTTVDVDPPRHAELRLVILAEGGLHCCGSSTIRSVTLRPVDGPAEPRTAPGSQPDAG